MKLIPLFTASFFAGFFIAVWYWWSTALVVTIALAVLLELWTRPRRALERFVFRLRRH